MSKRVDIIYCLQRPDHNLSDAGGLLPIHIGGVVDGAWEDSYVDLDLAPYDIDHPNTLATIDDLTSMERLDIEETLIQEAKRQALEEARP